MLCTFFKTVNMEQINFHSHEQQDEFIYNLFDQKSNGTFIEVSCGNPLIGSNTYTLEKYKGWTGFSFDIIDIENSYQWSSKRTSQFIQLDATTEQLTNYLKEHVPADLIIDYISLDIDSDSILALTRIFDAGVKFKSITFEHEFHRLGDTQRTASREILEGLGMVRLFEDVRAVNIHGPRGETIVFEDWWIHPDYFDPSILTIQSSQNVYKDNVEALRKLKNFDYQSTHVCSAAWPNEYTLYWRPDEGVEYREKFKRYFGETSYSEVH